MSGSPSRTSGHEDPKPEHEFFIELWRCVLYHYREGPGGEQDSIFRPDEYPTSYFLRCKENGKYAARLQLVARSQYDSRNEEELEKKLNRFQSEDKFETSYTIYLQNSPDLKDLTVKAIENVRASRAVSGKGADGDF